jgi:medium-chain acyl-[acyl-carrier-protein] hydrolase
MRQLVDDLATAILDDLHGEMWAVFGHSLGALIGFELVYEILRRRGPEPRHLIVSGCAAPPVIRPDIPAISTLSEPEMVRHLRALGGTPEWVLTRPSALRLLLRIFRADAQLRESWRYRCRRPLPIPITAIAARPDERAPAVSMQPWAEQTAWPEIAMHTLPGHHLAALQPANEDWLCSVLREALWPWASMEPLTPPPTASRRPRLGR